MNAHDSKIYSEARSEANARARKASVGHVTDFAFGAAGGAVVDAVAGDMLPNPSIGPVSLKNAASVALFLWGIKRRKFGVAGFGVGLSGIDAINAIRDVAGQVGGGLGLGNGAAAPALGNRSGSRFARENVDVTNPVGVQGPQLVAVGD